MVKQVNYFFSTFLCQTNNEFNQPLTGFIYANSFEHWGASVQPWYWTKRYNTDDVLEMLPSLMAQHALEARNSGAEIIEFEAYHAFLVEGPCLERRASHKPNKIERMPRPQSRSANCNPPPIIWE